MGIPHEGTSPPGHAMKWRQRTLDEIADMICGNGEGTPFVYRSSSYITRFFRDADTDFAHDGSTRAAWVSGALEQILGEPHPDAQTPPPTFCRVVATLMDSVTLPLAIPVA